MATPDRGRSEDARLQALSGYRILDTSPEQAFDDLAELAAAVCDTPVASIAFVDGERSWFKAHHGIELAELPRETALSSEALRHTDLFIVPDAQMDLRYGDSEFVGRGYRFFAGMPLRSQEGHVLGALSVIDTRPRELSATQANALRAIARRVMGQLEMRRISQLVSSGAEGFRPLVEQLPGAVYIEKLGASSGSYFSPRIEALTGYSPEEWTSAPDFFASVLHPDDREWALAETARAHETGEPIRIEYRLIAKDGRVIWIQDDAAVARDADGNPCYFQGMLADITERRELTAERGALLERLREQNERLLDVDRVKDELLAMVSHELRTPLTSILGYLDLVREDHGLTEEQTHFLKVIDHNAQRLLALVSDLLFVAHAQAGPVALDKSVVAVRDVVEKSVVAAQPAAATRSVELTCEAGAGIDVEGDVHRLGQVIDNLLSNAVKFTPPGGSVLVRLLTSGGRAVIEVSDTGMGMSEADQKALFVRFFRTQAARKKAIHGTGLGLSIVKAIVEAHRGEITVDSTEGVGTTFRVFLPMTAAETAPAGAPEIDDAQVSAAPGTTEVEIAPMPRTQPLVLVADDDAEILDLVRLRLTRFGYDTILADDGRQAIGLARAYKPDLALIDVSMPELDGYDVTRELKQDPMTREIAVILLTALADGKAITRGFEAGADDYITKPFSPQDLESRVATMLARTGQPAGSAPNRNGIRVVRSA